MKKIYVFLLVVFLLAGAAMASPDEKIRKLAVGEQYWKGALHRFFLGKDYRKLWSLPIDIEILDLENEAGGLTPVMTVGGLQTKGLALKGADGRSYTFRGLHKHPAEVLPPILEGTIAERIVQDQMSADHPAAPLVAAPLMEAAGVLTTPIKIVIMPDDPSLDDFRSDFKDLMGTFQEFPTTASASIPGFAGISEILDHREMWERLEAGPADRIDTRAFLKVRLVDILMGDWDRHRKQWRWAYFSDRPLWQPIPEDRDHAFVRYDGLLLFIVRPSYPFLLNFGDKYPGINALTLGSWGTDRYLLTDLERSDFRAVAQDLKSRLTDSVIEAAVGALPPEYYQCDGARLENALKKRRDGLLEVADQFYQHLARWVDIQMTDRAELVEIVWIDRNTVDVRISLKPDREDQPAPDPYYQRRFHQSETKEIRLHLRAGDDKVITRGRPGQGIRFRVIGGPGQDTFDNSEGGGLRAYDATGDSKVIRGIGTRLNENEYTPPPHKITEPPQDWGHLTIPTAWFGGGPDIGLFLGGGFNNKTYRFRKNPYSSSQTLRVGYASTPGAFRMRYRGKFNLMNSRARFDVSARASGIEILRFYGFGNETSREKSSDYYRVRQEQYIVDPSFIVPLADAMTFSIGPTFKYAVTKQDEDRIITALQPYGSENFGQLGIWTQLEYDSRKDRIQEPGRIRFSLEGRYFPELLDVKSPFGAVQGEVSVYLSALSLSIQPTLAVRLGGKHVFGDYPFHEAAFLGGGGLFDSDSSIRGFRAQRFAGDSCLLGNIELRVRLSEFYFLVPGELGVFGLGDIGRVYFKGETSNKWHTSLGGGLWFSLLERAVNFSAALAKSDEQLSIYVGTGFFF